MKHTLPTIRALISSITVVFLMGCDPAPVHLSCSLGEENFLNDSDFSKEAESGRSKHWTGIQHAGEKSFKVSFEGPIAVIEKIGSQPWFLYRQRLRTDQFSSLKMAFTAEINLSSDEKAMSGNEDGLAGLRLAAIGSSGKPIMRAENRLSEGSERNEWHTVQVIMQVPKATKSLQASIFHESVGTLRVRNPSLRLVEGTTEDCPLSPAL
ncbi:MAG: hypothetical protein ABJK20_02095 [Halieaceae bacterium]